MVDTRDLYLFVREVPQFVHGFRHRHRAVTDAIEQAAEPVFVQGAAFR